MTSAALLGWSAALALLGVLVLVVLFVIPTDPTFDCAEHEVGVWVDYDDGVMDCVADTDHAAHGGHGG